MARELAREWGLHSRGACWAGERERERVGHGHQEELTGESNAWGEEECVRRRGACWDSGGVEVGRKTPLYSFVLI